MQNLLNFKCPYIDKREIWRSADTFRTKYWPEETLPVDIESIVEKRLRLNIEPVHGLLDQLDIDAYLKRDLTGIVVDFKCYMEEKFINRLRFSYAHEVDHLILHNDLYIQFPMNNLDEWKNFILDVPDREYGFIEYQANEFAGRLLVPRDVLVSELGECLKQIEEVGLPGYLATDPEAVLARISPSLCKPFGVSYQVIERRVEREDLWPPETQ